MEFKSLNRTINKYNLFFFICLTYVLLFSQLFAGSVNVSGKVVTGRYGVRQALVTFIDNNDTTNKYTAITDDNGKYQMNVVTSLASQNQTRNFSLGQNYPNPFSSSTAISFKLKTQSDARITIYDILGREIKKFTLGLSSIGSHTIVWNGKNQFGEKVAPGIYFYRLQTGSKSIVRKMLYNSNFNDLDIAPSGPFLSENTSGGNAAVENVQVISYTVRVESMENTLPFVVEKQFDNISVYNDTTINFAVGYLPTASIDFDSLRQIIRGFGASNIIMWRPDMTDSEIQTAFGTGDGQLGFTILRLMVEANSDRWSLYVPTAKKALDMGAIIIASPWYAPAEMVETFNGVDRVRHDMYTAYAAHLDSFVSYMANNDVPIYGISVQNEPDITDQWTSWTSNEMFTFVKENAQAITGTKVMAPESFHFDRAYSDPILNDSVACANTDIICGHIYGGGLAPYPLAEQKGKEVWMTEYLINSNNPPSDIDIGWTGAMQTAQSINSCMNASMSAYVWWYIVRYYGPIADGTYATKGDVTKKGYVMSHFSRFVRPGDYRVNSSIYPFTSNFLISAYRDSLNNKEVIVAINTSTTANEVVINMQNRIGNTFTPYTTSEFKNVVQGNDISVDNNQIILNLDASSITTFISQ